MQSSALWAMLASAIIGVAVMLSYSPRTASSIPVQPLPVGSAAQLQAFPDRGAAFPLPPRWVVRMFNWLLYRLQALRDAMLPPQLRLLELHFGFVRNRALYAAAELGIADVIPPSAPLSEWPTSAEIAQEVSAADDELVYRFMRLLASMDVFEELPGRRFGHTQMSLLLRADHPQSIRASILCFGTAQYHGWNGLTHMLRTGQTGFDHINGGHDLWHYYNEPQHKQELGSFQEMLVQTLSLTTPPIVKDFSWPSLLSEVRSAKGEGDPISADLQPVSIADVGGGLGTVLHLILSHLPRDSARGILFDQEAVIEKAKAQWSRDPLVNSTQFVAGTFFGQVPEADVYVLRMVLHDWSDEQAAQILMNVRAAMKPHSRLVVIENVMPPEGQHSHLVPLSVEVQDLHMMVMLNGKERTGEEFRSLFASADLDLVRSAPTRGIYHMMVARRSGEL